MKHIYPEETYTREIFKTLSKRLHKNLNSIEIEVEGAGIHWYCMVKKGERSIKFYCIEIDRRDIANPDYKGVMYDVSFYEKEERVITGRAFKKEEALKSVEDWFNGIQKETLYSKYDFIDNRKKRLTVVLDDINRFYPKIKELAEENSVKEMNWSKRIVIKKVDRSCEGYYYAYEDNPRFIFKWDDARIFEHSTSDNKRVGELINDWIIDFSMPSTLASKFSEVNFGKLGGYYEQGKGIEGEYVLSWDAMENFYGKLSDEWHPFKKDALRFIREMRSYGLDKELRAGQSMFFFILSRARRHGLNTKHSYVHLTFLGENKMKIKSSYDDSRKEELFDAKYEGYIKEIIEKLLKEKIE